MPDDRDRVEQQEPSDVERLASLLYGRPLVRGEVIGGPLDGLPVFHEPPASPRDLADRKDDDG